MFEQIIIKRCANKMARKTTGLIISNLIFPKCNIIQYRNFFLSLNILTNEKNPHKNIPEILVVSHLHS